MVAIPHEQAIYNIINVKTSYTGGWYPNNKALNEINATSKFIVYPGSQISTESHWYIEKFEILIQSTSATTLNAMVRTILACDSGNTNGFVPNGTQIVANDYPYYITFISSGEKLQIGKNEFQIKLILYASFEL